MKFCTLMLMFLLFDETVSLVDPVDESKVKSWAVERRKRDTDKFTVTMKSSHRCFHEWCEKYFSASFKRVVDEYESCICTCNPNFPSFIPSMKTCINVTQAGQFGECIYPYFDEQTLLAETVDLTKHGNKKVNTNETNCQLSGDYYIHDYTGFEATWKLINDSYFTLQMEKGYFDIKWTSRNPALSGRIVRLVVTCSTSFARCVLLKAKKSVTYNAPVSSSVSPTLTTLSSSNNIASTEILHSSTRIMIHPEIPSKATPTLMTSSSSIADVGPGDKGARASGNQNGVVIGAAVGGAVVLGLLVFAVVFCKRRMTGKRSEKPVKSVINPKYGSSDNEFQLETPKESTDKRTVTEPLYYVLKEQDYDAVTVGPVYYVLEGPDSEEGTPGGGPGTTEEAVYNVLEGPNATHSPTNEQGPSQNDAIYNVLESPDAEKSPILVGNGPSNEPLYNVLEEQNRQLQKRERTGKEYGCFPFV